MRKLRWSLGPKTSGVTGLASLYDVEKGGILCDRVLGIALIVESWYLGIRVLVLGSGGVFGHFSKSSLLSFFYRVLCSTHITHTRISQLGVRASIGFYF